MLLSMPSPLDIANQPSKRNKARLSFDAQVKKLVGRGLSLTSQEEADLREFLELNNYYRFSGYFCQFYEPDSVKERFESHVTVQDLIEIYELDAELRLLLFEGIQKIETLLRTKMAYHLTQGSHGATKYLRESSYLPAGSRPSGMEESEWEEKISGQQESRDTLLKSISQTLERDEAFLKHFKQRKIEPPLWVTVEALSLGDLSKMVSVWRDQREIQEVTKSLGFRKWEEFRRAVGNVAYFRNRTAHHARLFGLKLTRPVAHSPWPGSRKAPFETLGQGSPIYLLNLIANWVDYLEGDSSYSGEMWRIVQANYLFAEGMRIPRL